MKLFLNEIWESALILRQIFWRNCTRKSSFENVKLLFKLHLVSFLSSIINVAPHQQQRHTVYFCSSVWWCGALAALRCCLKIKIKPTSAPAALLALLKIQGWKNFQMQRVFFSCIRSFHGHPWWSLILYYKNNI